MRKEKMVQATGNYHRSMLIILLLLVAVEAVAGGMVAVEALEDYAVRSPQLVVVGH
jgi:hypothetical protein